MSIPRFALARASTLRPQQMTPMLVAGILALTFGLAGHHSKPVKKTEMVSAPVISSVTTAPHQAVQGGALGAAVSRAMTEGREALGDTGAQAASAIEGKPESATLVAEVDDGQTFADVLMDAGVPDAQAASLMNTLSQSYDLRGLKAGQDITLSFLRSSQADTFNGAVFQPDATTEVRLVKAPNGTFSAEVHKIPVTRQRMAGKAEIHSTLYEAADRAGVPHAVMAQLIKIYAHDVDFQRDLHRGDSFEVLYDQAMTAQGKAVGEGTILYAALKVAGKVRPIYRVTFADKTSDYFDEQGHSTRRTLLRTPVAAAHITSGFGMRMHPLLGYSKMHKGVDFGAPIGTPIFAAGSGTVDEIGFKNGYGRYIRIRHNGKLSTAYAHMSRFNAHLYRGANVGQGEVIGYVGMSGRATGPHLHFEVMANGAQVNPMSVNMPTGRVLEGKLLADFRQGQSKIRQEFSQLTVTQAQTGKDATLVMAKAN